MGLAPPDADADIMATPLLAAALIVRNEVANLPDCLASLRTLGPLLDHIAVYDTGSTDRSPELARELGARVERGFWDGDFARARNAAVALTTARWVICVDADERVVADVDRLRDVLSAGLRPSSELDALIVPLVNVAPDGTDMYSAPLGRIHRPDRARFAGRVHERVQPLDPAAGELRFAEQSPDVVRLRHLGYVDPVVVRAKAERNLAIADADVEALLAGTDGEGGAALARALYQRGRTLISAGRLADARADLERLDGSQAAVAERTWGRDVLAQLLLASGELGPVPSLVGRLRAAGVDERYCRWLEAQVLLAQARYAEALPLLRTIDHLVDAVGRSHDLTPVIGAQMIAAGRVGAVDEAAACCIRLMAGYGRPEGLGSLLLTLWGTRSADALAELLANAASAPEHLLAVSRELGRCDPPGPEVAAGLARYGEAAPRNMKPRPQPAASKTAPSS